MFCSGANGEKFDLSEWVPSRCLRPKRRCSFLMFLFAFHASACWCSLTRMELPAVWPWVRGFPCFIPLPSFPIQISEVKENGCPANACWCSLNTGWRCPRQVLWPWVRGEGTPASGHAGSCIAHSQDRRFTLLGIVAHQEYVYMIRYH